MTSNRSRPLCVCYSWLILFSIREYVLYARLKIAGKSSILIAQRL
jgi:hypothetical protein